jgi:gamma-glutamylcyclotransferase (GGCT)/AIG2-like uncharacterized protein YtfP
MSDASCPYLFVYGTLRRASTHPMARFLAERATYLGKARAPGRLYDLGRYPGMTESEVDGEWVQGEVYRLHEPGPTLAALDEYEGVAPRDGLASLFERRVVAVTPDTSECVTAWAYYYRGEPAEACLIPSGEYPILDAPGPDW